MAIKCICSATLDNRGLTLDGTLKVPRRNDIPWPVFFKEIYAALSLAYPKFHKMDGLCKAGLLIAESIKQKTTENGMDIDPNLAIVFNNSVASLESDAKHWKAVAQDAVSPAVFVYTLPNIVVGEIAIKWKCRGENQFFVSSTPAVGLLTAYISALFTLKKAKQGLVGWLEVNGDFCDIKMALVEKSDEPKGDHALLRRLLAAGKPFSLLQKP